MTTEASAAWTRKFDQVFRSQMALRILADTQKYTTSIIGLKCKLKKYAHEALNKMCDDPNSMIATFSNVQARMSPYLHNGWLEMKVSFWVLPRYLESTIGLEFPFRCRALPRAGQQLEFGFSMYSEDDLSHG